MVSSGEPKVVVLFASAVVLLLVSTLFCLLAMRIRRLTAPLESKEIERMVDEIFRLGPSEFTDEVVENFVRDQVNAWQKSLRSLGRTNTGKADRVLYGQILLAVAILLVAVVVLFFLVHLRPPGKL